ncbi:60S ribosomal protein L22-like, partial [Bombyx mandarina]
MHARFAQVSEENGHLRAENGQIKVDMAELRTVVNDLVEKQRSSAPVPPPPEVEDESEAEELRRQLLISEARSSKVERARPPLAHEAKGAAPTPAPRKKMAAKTYGGPKKDATPAARSAASAAAPAKPGSSAKDTGAPKPAPSRAPITGQPKTQK